MSKAVGMAKKAISGAVEAGGDMLVSDTRHKELAAVNQRLLHGASPSAHARVRTTRPWYAVSFRSAARQAAADRAGPRAASLDLSVAAAQIPPPKSSVCAIL